MTSYFKELECSERLFRNLIIIRIINFRAPQRLPIFKFCPFTLSDQGTCFKIVSKQCGSWSNCLLRRSNLLRRCSACSCNVVQMFGEKIVQKVRKSIISFRFHCFFRNFSSLSCTLLTFLEIVSYFYSYLIDLGNLFLYFVLWRSNSLTAINAGHSKKSFEKSWDLCM